MKQRFLLMFLFFAHAATSPRADEVLTGKAALGDWTTDAPGVRRKITLADLATPYDTPSARNNPRVVRRPEGAWPKAPEGFEVTEFATKLVEPRVIVRATDRQDTHRIHRVASPATVTTRAQQIDMVIFDDAHANRSCRIYC
jgi:hypothetical protein